LSFGYNPAPDGDDPTEVEIRIFATRLLGTREYAIAELKARIERKWPGAQGIQTVVEEMVQENLVSDSRFAEAFVRSRRNKLQGPLKIRSAIRTRGVDDATLAQAMDLPESSWIELAEQWLNRQGCVIATIQDRSRYYRRLQNRGFTHSQAMTALGRVGTEP
jgi:regulatory protein